MRVLNVNARVTRVWDGILQKLRIEAAGMRLVFQNDDECVRIRKGRFARPMRACG